MSWLRELKVGDPVVVRECTTGVRIAKVDRCTDYNIWVDGRRFSRAHGFVVGTGPYSSCYLERYKPATEPRE